MSNNFRIQKFIKNAKALLQEHQVVHILSKSYLFVLDLVTSCISLLYQPQQHSDDDDVFNLSKQCSDDNILDLPTHYYKGEAVSNGDCFFDAVCQGLNQIGKQSLHIIKSRDEGISVKELRHMCADFFLKDTIELQDMRCQLEDDILHEGGYHHIHEYVARVQLTAKDVKDEPGKILNVKYPIWGRPEVEGKIICHYYNIILHVIEKHNYDREDSNSVVFTHQVITSKHSKSIESYSYYSDYHGYNDYNTVHICNLGKNHFEPILRQQSSNTLPHDSSFVTQQQQSNLIFDTSDLIDEVSSIEWSSDIEYEQL